MPKASVVISTYYYRRLKNLERILEAWLFQTPDVWLADSSGEFETSLPIRHVRFSPDPGNKSRHAVALLTDGDYVIKADDDVLPKPGLIEAFLNYSHLCGILGIMGRTYQGPKYYGMTTPYRAAEIHEPKKVDMVGIITFSPRQFLAFDLRGCRSPVEDLYWHNKIFPNVPKYAIPTDQYELFDNDACSLFKSDLARAEREIFYQIFYRKHYRK